MISYRDSYGNLNIAEPGILIETDPAVQGYVIGHLAGLDKNLVACNIYAVI